MLHLIKMWLEAPVEETDERGNKRRSTRNRDEGRGSPQGSPISPLLSNLYMRRFVLGWKKLGHERRLRAYIVNYADDLVICCRDKAADALVTMRGMMTKLKLTVNETKTRVCKLPEEKFDFLGYTFGRCYSPKTGRAYLGSTPSKKRVQRICKAISQETGRNKTLLAQETVITTLNRIMIGWANYFCLGPVSMPIELSNDMLARGCASGCVPSTSCDGPQPSNIRRVPPCIRCWASSSLPFGPAAFRGRNRDTFSESRMREMRLSGSMSGCSDASWRSSGERPARENCPVVSVVISGGGAGDQSVESPEVKVPVGWVEARSAPTRGARKSTGCSESEP